MNRNSYILLKGIASSSGLFLQILCINILGLDSTGILNQYQLIGLSISLFILPGFETSLLRVLPIQKDKNTITYLKELHLYFYGLKLLYVVIFCINLFILACLYLYSETSSLFLEILLTIGLGLYLFTARVTPMLYRIEKNMFASILSEPGVISILLSISVVVMNYLFHEKNILIAMSISILLSSIISFFLTKSLKNTEQNKYFIFKTYCYYQLKQLIQVTYSYTFSIISLSNYMILWGLATFGTFILSTEDIAKSVTIFRIIGALLFVEGAIVAYYLPNLVKDLSLKIKSSTFYIYQKYMIVVTIISGVFLILSSIYFQIIILYSIDFFVLLFVVSIQLLNVYLCSPFILAISVLNEKVIKNMGYLLIILSLCSYLLFYFIPYWYMLVLLFAILQMIRSIIGYYKFVNYMATYE